MLKYVDTKVTFSEVPDEITLCINISNCPCHCKGCHSPYLAKDEGKDLSQRALERLISENKGISCVAFMGGDSESALVNLLAEVVKKHGLLTCWYSGRQELSQEIDLKNFNFIKLGPYIEELGPLTSQRTNQRFYEVQLCREYVADGENTYPVYGLCDITDYFWKK